MNEVVFDIYMKYPFLLPRSYKGDFKIHIIKECEHFCVNIPQGWYKLFFQMCDDLKPIIEKEDLMSEFYFISVKEKYNALRCFTSKGTDEIIRILDKYEQMSQYICADCGAPAEFETKDYILSYCRECWKDNHRHEDVRVIDFKPYYTVIFEKFGKQAWEEAISFEKEWEKYINEEWNPLYKEYFCTLYKNL